MFHLISVCSVVVLLARLTNNDISTRLADWTFHLLSLFLAQQVDFVTTVVDSTVGLLHKPFLDVTTVWTLIEGVFAHDFLEVEN